VEDVSESGWLVCADEDNPIKRPHVGVEVDACIRRDRSIA
jgi:hypothetical protein